MLLFVCSQRSRLSIEETSWACLLKQVWEQSLLCQSETLQSFVTLDCTCLFHNELGSIMGIVTSLLLVRLCDFTATVDLVVVVVTVVLVTSVPPACVLICRGEAIGRVTF